ncbi:hypothetical protein RMN57_00630 [Kitasatospora sp. CM 4170]|uniref:Lipoprotein n=1 Tax=Kitasatospora aburaviensis TaxID=67265 RepID=A0ABW1F7Q2_9ACTN|nr:hypothetical protein [Kitasatospora sp. CM 4170]WNM43314.1 hypothetical protein RMN57_00630 [Kitasatospora sp. CM 4170]
MRKRFALAVGLAVAAAAAASGCGGHAAAPREAGPTVPPPPSAGSQSVSPPSADPPSADRLADCVLSITPWLQTSLDGGTDLGDYQEMGLSSAQGGALRELQRQAAALGARGPLPSGWVATEVRRACAAIIAAGASATSKPTGWP